MRPAKLLAVMMLSALGACGEEVGTPLDGSTPPRAAQTTESYEGGFGAPSQAPGEFEFGPGKPVNGKLRLASDGCWYAEMSGDERLLVLPVGFEQSPETGAELVDGAGATYRDGDRFDAVGSIVPGALIPGGENGRWGNYMAFCQPRLDELAVFETLVEEFDPTSSSEAELAVMVENAAFTEHWDCGRGWAASTKDQRVGLVIYEADAPAAETLDRIVLPDREWAASILVGKNLFSENCNDAIEAWIALPTIAARWPLSAGTVIVTDPIPSPDEKPARVRAVLDNGEIETGSGTIQLPRTELGNVSFNFFAG